MRFAFPPYGLHFQGKTRQAAQTNITEAIEGYLESLAKHDELIPPGP